MNYTRQEAVDKLLQSYEVYYNVHKADSLEECDEALVARCDFYEHSQKYVLSRKAELWSADCEEFVYLFQTQCLTLEIYNRCKDYAYNDGMKRANIGPGHMYTYITPVFVCDSCEEEARKALKKCNLYKSFQFSLHGWLDVHTAVLDVNQNTIVTNRSGRRVEKVLKSVLFQKNKKRRGFL